MRHNSNYVSTSYQNNPYESKKKSRDNLRRDSLDRSSLNQSINEHPGIRALETNNSMGSITNSNFMFVPQTAGNKAAHTTNKFYP